MRETYLQIPRQHAEIAAPAALRIVVTLVAGVDAPHEPLPA